eukprot:TRINITY_DN27598_c0_g1_i1.p1 TRINITY_DN27598_c0_g1~~TRINITY_DN27598_c0_g1_i1.p1  ORF type:complete len:245 (-),score=67.15 TRINITY_DN27598_c0_g1_i1:130-798(-)
MSHIPWISLISLGLKLRDGRQERRGQTTFVRFENQNQEGQLAPPLVEVNDPQNPVFCLCLGLQSTIKTLGYAQLVLLVLGTLIAGVATALLTTADHPWYNISVIGAAFVMLLWVAGLFIAAALVLVKGVRERRRGFLRIWLVLNISGLVTSIILHSIAATAVLQTDYYSQHALYGMIIQSLVCHVSWCCFVMLVGKLDRLLREGEKDHEITLQGRDHGEAAG